MTEVVPWAFSRIPFGSKENIKDLTNSGNYSCFRKVIRISEVDSIALALKLCRLGVAARLLLNLLDDLSGS